jgi:hypothetical protein
MRLLLELHKENSLFVRHYEDTRFKFSQITIALAAALVGVSRFPAMGGGSQHWVAMCIITLGLSGILITSSTLNAPTGTRPFRVAFAEQ